jgi:hypothetical protein
MLQNQIKNLRPTDYDITFRYVCPNCSNDHWVRLKQVQYEKFVIVCDCDTILKIKPIESIKLKFKRKPKTKKQEDKEEIQPDLLNRCCVALTSYGFSKKESESLVKECYAESKSKDCINLVKLSLSKFGEKNGKCDSSVEVQ